MEEGQPQQGEDLVRWETNSLLRSHLLAIRQVHVHLRGEHPSVRIVYSTRSFAMVRTAAK